MIGLQRSDLDSKRLQVHLKRRGSQNLSANTDLLASNPSFLFQILSHCFSSHNFGEGKSCETKSGTEKGFGASRCPLHSTIYGGTQPLANLEPWDVVFGAKESVICLKYT